MANRQGAGWQSGKVQGTLLAKKRRGTCNRHTAIARWPRILQRRLCTRLGFNGIILKYPARSVGVYILLVLLDRWKILKDSPPSYELQHACNQLNLHCIWSITYYFLYDSKWTRWLFSNCGHLGPFCLPSGPNVPKFRGDTDTVNKITAYAI